MNTKIIAWSSLRARSRAAAVRHETRWYSALAPNMAASARAYTQTAKRSRDPSARTTSTMPAATAAKNAYW